MSERQGDRTSRRDTMLAALTSVMRAHHRRRAVRRGAAAVLVAAAAAAWALAGRNGTPRTGPLAGGEAPGGVVSDHGIVLVATAPRTRRIRIIGDEELVRRLAGIGRPSGLIRAGDSAWLTDPVTSE